MKKSILKIRLITLIIILFLGLGIQHSFANEVSINSNNDRLVSENIEPSEASDLVYLYGRIKNLWEDDYEKSFNAVNLRIRSLIPFGFYHLDSGEEVHIICLTKEVFPFFGIITDNFIIGLCEVSWNS